MKTWVRLSSVTVSFIIILLLCFFSINKPELYAQIGKFYLKQNNYNQAQNYFEKSYALGNKDTNFRIMYVNSLVNSPLTIEAQEKLVDIANDDIKDSASDSAEYFLHNLKKEIHNKYPNNYIKQASYNQKIIHWGKMPITYSFKNKRGVPKDLIDAVNDAFDTWELASSARIRFERIQSDNADIVVHFTGKVIKNPKDGVKYIIANTTPVLSQNKLEKMEILLNVYDFDKNFITSNQIYNTSLHEVFHALGLMGHSQEKENIMYMAKNQEDLEEDTRQVLSDADKVTLELLYKIKPDITNDNELKYEYIPYLVLGNASEVKSAKIDEIKNYIRKAPTIPAGYIDYAQILLNEKKYTSAISYLEKALRLSTDEETKNLVYYNLAVANYYDGSYELARVYLNKVKESDDRADIHVLNAEIYLKQGNLKEGIKEYEYLANKYPHNMDYAINLANIFIKEKKYLKARKVLKEYIRKNPKDKTNSIFSHYKILLF